MRPTLQGSDVASRAAEQARDAAGAAGIEIREVHSLEDIRSVSELFDRVWGSKAGDPLMAPGMLRALTHAGNYAAGAFVDGHDDRRRHRVHGHRRRGRVPALAHPRRRGRTPRRTHRLRAQAAPARVGARERHAQGDVDVRSARPEERVLQRPEAGCRRADEYLVRFYGSMSDDINAGDETDRLLIVWDVDSTHVEAAASGKLGEPNVAVLREQGAAVALDENGACRRRRMERRRPLRNARTTSSSCVTPTPTPRACGGPRCATRWARRWTTAIASRASRGRGGTSLSARKARATGARQSDAKRRSDDAAGGVRRVSPERSDRRSRWATCSRTSP